MSALYVSCPKCGPLFSFITQKKGWAFTIHCNCGRELEYEEPLVQTGGLFTKTEIRNRVNRNPLNPVTTGGCRNGFE